MKFHSSTSLPLSGDASREHDCCRTRPTGNGSEPGRSNSSRRQGNQGQRSHKHGPGLWQYVPDHNRRRQRRNRHIDRSPCSKTQTLAHGREQGSNQIHHSDPRPRRSHRRGTSLEAAGNPDHRSDRITWNLCTIRRVWERSTQNATPLSLAATSGLGRFGGWPGNYGAKIEPTILFDENMSSPWAG